MKKLGFIVNPIAGMGGRVGLNGTDGPDTFQRAQHLGAKAESPHKARIFLEGIFENFGKKFQLYVASGSMGEEEARTTGLEPVVIGRVLGDLTTAQSTKIAAGAMEKIGVDLLVFVGGDGTASDIYDAVGDRLVVLGVPAGVKMYSGVYANSPISASSLVAKYLDGESIEVQDQEIIDVDEQAFKMDRLHFKLHGYLRVPYHRNLVQGSKDSAATGDEKVLEDIAADFVETMQLDVIYVIGPGTTTQAIVRRLGLDKKMLGVGLLESGKLFLTDATEKEIIEAIDGNEARILVAPVGGQGHIFGRGNQQISPLVIRMAGRENIIVVASPMKLMSLAGAPLLVDTGDLELDEDLRGYINVRMGYRKQAVYRVS